MPRPFHGGGEQTTPDAPPDVAVPAVTPGCVEVAQQSPDAYSKASDFGPVVPGTLAGWDPDGRWFLTGTQVGSVSSFFFEKQGSQVIVDRDPAHPGTIDDDELFQYETVNQGIVYTVAKRVSNRAADGSFRAERAVCDGGTCRVCTAVMIRAEHFNHEGEGDGLALLGQLSDPTWGPGYTFNVRIEGLNMEKVKRLPYEAVELSPAAE